MKCSRVLVVSVIVPNYLVLLEFVFVLKHH